MGAIPLTHKSYIRDILGACTQHTVTSTSTTGEARWIVGKNFGHLELNSE